MTYKNRVPNKGEKLDEPATISHEEILNLNPECDRSIFFVSKRCEQDRMHTLTFKVTPSSHPNSIISVCTIQWHKDGGRCNSYNYENAGAFIYWSISDHYKSLWTNRTWKYRQFEWQVSERPKQIHLTATNRCAVHMRNVSKQERKKWLLDGENGQ